ncbi:MAG: tetratricopeptide repeat protein [Bacteroidia bacterium]|nr:tetratricopeptide repeat protein [Bacteroidia bacterium]
MASTQLHSTSLDSLKIRYKTTQKTSEKVDVLFEIISEYYTRSDYKNAEIYLREAELLGANDKRIQVRIQYTKGRIKKNTGIYFDAEKLYYSGLQQAQQLHDSSLIAAGYNNLGNLFIPLGKYKEALAVLQQSQRIYEKIGEIQKSAYPISNIAKIYEFQKNYPLALEHYIRSKNIALLYKDHFEVAQTYKRLAGLNLKLNHIAQCNTYCDSVFLMCKQFGYSNLLADAHEIKGMMFQNQKQYDKAKAEFMLSMELYKQLDMKPSVMNSFKKLSDIYGLLNQPLTAMEYLKQYYQLKDTLFNSEEKLKLEVQQYHYEKELLKIEMNHKAALEADRKNKRMALIALAGAMLIVLMALWFVFYKKQEKIRKKLEMEQVKNQISADLHDDVGASLSSLSIYVELLKKRAKRNESVDDILNNMNNMAKEMIGKMSDIIWSIKLDQMGISDMVQRLEQNFALPLVNNKIQLVVEVDQGVIDTEIPSKKLKDIYLIFKEGINNSIKYSGSETIKFSIKKSTSAYEFVLSDAGLGFHAEEKASTGNGLTNMKRRAESIGAAFEVTTAKGKGTRIGLVYSL